MTIDTDKLRALLDAPYWKGEEHELISRALPELLAVYEAACKLVDDWRNGWPPRLPRGSFLLEEAIDAARGKQ